MSKRRTKKSAETPEQRKEKKKKSKDQRKRAFQAMRTGDLNKLFAKRYRSTREDYVFPDDDAGIEDLRILLGHYAYSNPLRLTKIAALRAPWLTGGAIRIHDSGRYDVAAYVDVSRIGRPHEPDGGGTA